MAAGFSILDLKEVPHTDAPKAAFFTDLNLNQIIDKVTAVWGTQTKKYYLYFPLDAQCEAYRREVYGDVQTEEVFFVLSCFMDTAGEMEEARKMGNAVVSPLQKDVWKIREIVSYCRTFEELYEGLQKCDLVSAGMQEYRKLLGEYLGSSEFLSMKERAVRIQTELSSLRFVITYEKDRIVIREGSAEGDYEKFLDGYFPEERKSFKNPFRANPNLTDFERELLDILMEKKPKLFGEIQKCAKDYENYAKPELIRFQSEITFYLSYCSFEKEMKKNGFCFAKPAVNPERNMSAEGLYDLALACVAVKEDRQVVSNQMEYRDGESFFVLTGPNQGGKTTFARSLGQLVYFTKMGLDVPAKSANVHDFCDILTHFSVEESVETGRGKLKEELIRLAPMMHEHRGKAFVVINELFTTAATYDAEIMGRKVLEHFIGQDCRGIYVTHLKELTTVHPAIVSLRAMLNEERLQSFQIARSEAEESACAANQVNKYRLTYAQLKERL